MKAILRSTAAAGAVALSVLFPANAEKWFDAGIGDYSKFPPDECAGTWLGVEYGELTGEPGERRIKVDSPQTQALVFNPDVSQKVGTEVVTISTSVKMSISDSCDELAAPVDDAKCAITAVMLDEEGSCTYLGWAKDVVGGSNTWVALEGATPDKDATVAMTFELKEEGGARKVRYSVDGVVLRAVGGDEWLDSDCGTDDDASRVASVRYCGDGEIAALAGETEKAIALVAFTIPAVANMTIASVKVGGVVIEPQDGVYQVPQGAIVTVVFTPDAGWALSKTRVAIKMGEEPMEFPSAELPTAVNVGSEIRINEIMASNGSSLTTKNGTADIDWVELYNASDEAVDLTGWYMGNDPTAKASKWEGFKLQGTCVVPAHGYKIVWFDGDGLCTRWAADEAHVACNVSTTAGKHTVFLSPTANAADIVQQIKMPGMMKDVSYGIGHLERSLFGPRDAAQYRVGEGEWESARGPIGMSAESSDEAGFTVTSYKLNRQLTSVDVALSAIHDQAWKSGTQPSEKTGVKTIAYRSSGQSVSFPAAYYADFPTATEDLAVVVKGTVVIPESGLWTFSVGSDDGFRLTLMNEASSYAMEYAGTRAYGQTYSAFNMDAGAYNLELVYFDRNGGAALDLSVAKGDYTTAESGEFNTTAFHLLGMAECPVLFGGALAGFIATDVKDEMLGKARTLDWRGRFAVAVDELPTDADSVRLKIRYADGLVAKLNGTEIARKEATARTAAEALVYATFEIDSSLVQMENTLEITVTNDQIDDGELYLDAQVVMQKAEDDFVYFRESTPGKENTTHGFGPMTPAVSFSEQHGYKTEPFALTLSCAEAPYAPIYYTLDGTSPTEKSTLYTGPITVSKTTCIRAAVPQDNTILQVDCAATYLFLEDILKQSPNVVPEGFPADRAVNNHAMRYGFSAKGLANDPERLRRGFEEVATMSIVVDPKNLFDRAIGIYVNPSGDGRSWERQVMLEQINPNGDDAGFSVPAGIRIRGAASRGEGHAKHSFRFFFRGEYGMGSLEYPLFGDEGVGEFDKVDLRCSQNYSWANENSGNETFIHECFSRDTQRAMGDYYTKSRYYNLFINGQYWGLYQTQERGDEDFAASYNGGASGNYDVIKTSSPGYNTGANAGTEDAWKTLWQLIVNTPDGEKNYRRAMGLNEDGTRNEDYPVYLNPTNLIDYVLNFHFVCDSDAPISMSGFVNNLYAVRNRVDGDGKLDGFYFLRHDAEHSMGVRGESNANADPTAYGTEGANADWRNYGNRFSPAELFWRLTKNPEFKMLVADLYYKHLLKEGGALTAPVAKTRFEKRMAEIDSAVVAEAARWSQNRDNPWKYENWLDACNGRLRFIDERGSHMLSQYRARGWYPSVDAAKAVNGLGGTIADGTQFGADDRLYLTGGEQGKVYYTLDGSDPRLADGSLADGAVEYTGGSPVPVDVKAFDKGAEWKYFDAGSKPATDWMAADYDDSAWKSGNGRLGFAGSGTFGTKLNRYVGGGSSGTQITTYYFRKSFELPDNAAEITSLKVSLECDDAYAIYVNGTELRRENLPSGSLGYNTFSVSSNNGLTGEYELTFEAGLLQPSGNVIAVEVHQCNATSSDAWWDCSLTYPVAGGEATGLAVPATGMTLTMRVRSDSGEWSAVDTVRVNGEMPKATPAEALRVAEIMSSSASGDDDDDYLVLKNTAEGEVSLDGVKIVAWNAKKKSEADPSLTYVFGDGQTLPPGASLKLTNLDKLTNSQVGLRIYDADGALVQDVFVDADWWNSACDGAGASFVAKTFGSEAKTQADWHPSEAAWSANLRVLELYTSTAGDGGDTGEYVVLTNLDATTALDLTDVKIVAWNAKKKSEADPSLVLTLADLTIPAGGTLTLDQATYFGDGKLTNSKVGLKIYDPAGDCAQEVAVDADWWGKACDGTGASFLALEFGSLVNTDSQWTCKLPAPADWPENPDEDITDDTKPSDLGITEGAFAVATTDELRKLAKWAKANAVAFGGAAVNAMAFDADGNPATVLEEAYLLNCAPTEEAVADAKAEFKFNAIIPGVQPEIDGDFNGTVKVFGTKALGPGEDWTPNNPDACFYRAVLTR